MSKVGFLVLCAVFGCAFAATPWKLCTDFSGGNIKVDSVAVPGCDAAPCILKKGTNATVAVMFTPSVAERDITNKVYGVIKGIPVPFPLSEADACKLGVSCPVSANTDVNEKAIFIILKEYPSITLLVKWELMDEDGKEQACFLLDVQITD